VKRVVVVYGVPEGCSSRRSNADYTFLEPFPIGLAVT
jgi:hypothetical protein